MGRCWSLLKYLHGSLSSIKDTGIFTSNVLLIDFEVNFQKLKLL